MDPNEMLNRGRKAANVLHRTKGDTWDYQVSSQELAAAFEALDRWLTRGGTPPADWQPSDRQER